jgi:lipid A 3-O-deacylase
MNRFDMISCKAPVILSLLAFVLAPLAALASDRDIPLNDVLHHVSFGYLAHDVSGLWSGFRIETAATAENLDVVFAPHIDLLGGTIRPALGGTITNGSGTSYGYADARFEISGPLRTFFGVGLGLAVHDGSLQSEQTASEHRKKALGSRALFHVPLEIGVAPTRSIRLSAYFEHVSNGWLGTSVNEGMDNLGLRIGYVF